MKNVRSGECKADFSVKKEANTVLDKVKITIIEKNSAAVMLGRLGGLKGGKARAASLSAEKRSQIAKAAAIKRWTKKVE